MRREAHPQPSICRRLSLLSGGLALTAIAGCHSAFIRTTVTNHTGQPVPLFEVDYPSASFGGSTLAPDGTFSYRFKVLGTGPVKLSWTDAAQHEHTATGPVIREGQEGSLTITIQPHTTLWSAELHPK